MCKNLSLERTKLSVWLFWGSLFVPKHRLLADCAQQAFYKRHKLEKNINPLSVLCNQSNETWHHLDFTCLYARPTWHYLLQKCNVNRPIGDWQGNSAEPRWVTKSSEDSFLLSCEALPGGASLYLIWREKMLDVMKENAPPMTVSLIIFFLLQNVSFQELQSVILPLYSHYLQ